MAHIIVSEISTPASGRFVTAKEIQIKRIKRFEPGGKGYIKITRLKQY
ncbi:hypothetical protein [Neobacillus sp. 19]